ncbi:hypothetical protein D9M68_934980 [compost metagenome]
MAVATILPCTVALSVAYTPIEPVPFSARLPPLRLTVVLAPLASMPMVGAAAVPPLAVMLPDELTTVVLVPVASRARMPVPPAPTVMLPVLSPRPPASTSRPTVLLPVKTMLPELLTSAPLRAM